MMNVITFNCHLISFNIIVISLLLAYAFREIFAVSKYNICKQYWNTWEYFFLLTVNNLHTQDGVKSHDIINGDIFFEIIEPQELEYTYRLKPAKDFGTTFTTEVFIQQRYHFLVDFNVEI